MLKWKYEHSNSVLTNTGFKNSVREFGKKDSILPGTHH